MHSFGLVDDVPVTNSLQPEQPATLIAVIGLGYVGLPLALAFGGVRETIGFDIDTVRISELAQKVDRTNEATSEDFVRAQYLKFTSDPKQIQDASTYIITVPTPIDLHKRPDLTPLASASALVGGLLAVGDLVIYESTVYPGATDEYCTPILEETSGLSVNTEFFVGYSPERINPGDLEHSLVNIRKVTSGSSVEAAQLVDDTYALIIKAGTVPVSSIRIAEAAKVIENIQRDVNIALINELSVLFAKLNIDTHEVLDAASTKWNFLPFRPGLVGGHCIGVDPYYLTHKAQEVGHHPEVILAGRRINDGMGREVVNRVLLAMTKKQINVNGARVLVLGLAFKENCPDIRNSRVVDVIRGLEEYGAKVDVYDPFVEGQHAFAEYQISLVSRENLFATNYDVMVHAVAHAQFPELVRTLTPKLREPSVIFDVKGTLPRGSVDGRL